MARRINHDLHSPTVLPVAAFSDTADLTKTVRAIDILTGGTLKVTDIEDNDVTYTFTNFNPAASGAYTLFPYRLELQIKRIWATGTSLTPSEVVCLH